MIRHGEDKTSKVCDRISEQCAIGMREIILRRNGLLRIGEENQRNVSAEEKTVPDLPLD
jgi:hypothetical protein